MEGARVPSSLSVLLQKGMEEKIVNCSVASGSKAGDNVVGKLISVKTTTASGSTNDLLVKAAVSLQNDSLTHDEKVYARMIAAFEYFKTELGYYHRIKPGLKEIQNGYELPSPKIFFGQDDKENGGVEACLIMEDLRPKGYKMADKMKGLTLDEVILVLEKIAKLHAASYVYLKKIPVRFDDINDPLTIHIFEKAKFGGSVAVKAHQDFTKRLCFGTCEIGREAGVISSEVYDKIVKLTPDPRELILNSSQEATKEYFPVVIHGDLWVNNILYKYNETGIPVDVSFVDFQQCRYSSVFDELHYFMYTSTTTAFRKENLDKCLNFYFEKFHEAIKNLHGHDLHDEVIRGFTQEAFWAGYKKFLRAAFCYGLVAIPFQLGIAPTDLNFSTAPEKHTESSGVAELEAELEIQNTVGTGNRNENACCHYAYFDNELRKSFVSTFDGMGTGLLSAVKNSPVALTRLGEFCREMNELGIFEVHT